jgi:hypothetical protein
VPGELAHDGSGASPLLDVHAQVELGADGVPLGAVSIEVDDADPRPGNDAGSLLRHLAVCNANLGTLGRTDPGDAIPAPRSSGALGPKITGLLLSGPPGSSSPSIDWR